MATEKFKALVHFIVHECSDHPQRLGAVRLNKTLWYTDVMAFKMNGVPVTGETYVKQAKDPVPAHILATLRELRDEGKILIREPEYQFDTRKYLSLVAPHKETLSEEERVLASTILDTVCGHTANGISEMTHDIIWEAAAEGEEIPLKATLVAETGEVTDSVREWAESIIHSREMAA